MTTEGTILHLQRLSTEDGPGIRTTVFFKGCPLRCAWCHNPESIALHPQVQWLENRCIGCGTCLAACPQHALSRVNADLVRDRKRCLFCAECVEACPSGAQELLGSRVNAISLVAELVKDRAFYEKSGGGVTLSGGEPALQPVFAQALLDALHSAGIQTALDTCGLCAPETLQSLVERADLVLFDVKLLDADLHRYFTGADNARILENLRWLGGYLGEHPEKMLWVRTPLILGATISEENITGIGAWLVENLPGRVARWELCAFNNLCRDKYRRLGLEWVYASTPLLSPDDLQQANTWAQRSGFEPDRIFVTGPTWLEE